MYLEFLLRRAHSRGRGERRYWSGVSLYSRTTCSNSVMVGTIGPMGSGLPQFGFPRRLAMKRAFRTKGNYSIDRSKTYDCSIYMILRNVPGFMENGIPNRQSRKHGPTSLIPKRE